MSFVKHILEQVFAALRSRTSAEEERFAPQQQWWKPEKRLARAAEAALPCEHCHGPLGCSEVAICPECKLVLHSHCYEDTEGGSAFASPGCKACRHRTHWR